MLIKNVFISTQFLKVLRNKIIIPLLLYSFPINDNFTIPTLEIILRYANRTIIKCLKIFENRH